MQSPSPAGKKLQQGRKKTAREQKLENEVRPYFFICL